MFNIIEQLDAMNKRDPYEQVLKNACARLHELTGLKTDLAPVFQTPGISAEPDAILVVAPAEGPAVEFAVRARRFLTTQNLQAEIERVAAVARDMGVCPLLVAEHVNPNIARRLRDIGINYLDAAGNMYLRCPTLLVDIQGRRQAPVADKPRAIGPKALQLVALLLANPEFVNATARELAKAAGIALGGVPRTLHELEARGLLRRTGLRQLTIRNAGRLLELWVQGYADTLRPRLILHRYRLAPDFPLQELRGALDKAGTGEILIGGEAAAAAYTNYLTPEGATLHLFNPDAVLPPRLFLPDARGNVDVLRGFGHAPEPWTGPLKGFAHPLLVYGELLAIGGNDRRMAETAKLLLERFCIAGREATDDRG
jgi:hypothetical protein